MIRPFKTQLMILIALLSASASAFADPVQPPLGPVGYTPYQRPAAYDSWQHNGVVEALELINQGASVSKPLKGQVYDFVRYADRELMARDARTLAGTLVKGAKLAKDSTPAGDRVSYLSKDGKHEVKGIVVGEITRRGKTYQQILVAPSGNRPGMTVRNVSTSRIVGRRAAAQY